MTNTRFRVGAVGSTDIHVDLVSASLVVLMMLHLAVSVMPILVPELEAGQYWTMAALAVFGFIASLVLREGITLIACGPVKPDAITVYIFGGVPERTQPIRPLRLAGEWLVATLVSLLTALLLVWLFADGFTATTPLWVSGTVFALVGLNLILVVINTLPIHPARGGQMLEGLMTRITGHPRKGRRIAIISGTAIAAVAGLAGVIFLTTGSPGMGGWLAAAAAVMLLAAANSRTQSGG